MTAIATPERIIPTGTWNVDPTHSQVDFAVKHLGISTVRGTFWVTDDRCDGTVTQVKQGRVEVRDFGTGKQVVVPPSIHPSGQPYRWLTALTTLPLLPVAIHAAIDEARKEIRTR